ncbi:MAG: hypothetical protein ACXW1W_07725 [Methylococcaceae bacterium]
MRKYFLNLTLILLTAFSLSAYAETSDKAGIPKSIMDQLLKRHPDALDITAEQKNHFKQDLYAVAFKEKDALHIEFYRPNGGFFVSGEITATAKNSDLLPLNSHANLTTEFSNYEIKKVIRVINPNGAGEEYDFIIASGGRDFDVSMDRKGNIYFKQPR